VWFRAAPLHCRIAGLCFFVASRPNYREPPARRPTMRPTVYFPELRFGRTVIPAHAASGIETSSRVNEQNIATREKLRVENAQAPLTPRRRPVLDSIVIEA
jgi:hypothetical protein